MKYTKKTLTILSLVVALAVIFTATAYALTTVHVTGYVPLGSLMEDEFTLEYDVCDPFLVGHAVQPAEWPSPVIPVSFTAGPIPDPDCPYSADFVNVSGRCRMQLIPVPDPFNPASADGKARLLKCSGDLAGMQAWYIIHYDFTYDAWYYVP